MRIHMDTIAALMIDVDRFKRINDAFGHAGGDRVLMQVARAMREALRPGDVFGRVGGEEFLALLPEVGLDEALALAERLRRAVADSPIVIDGEHLDISVSIGVARMQAQDTELTHLVERADMALYTAKTQGRDRVSSEASATARHSATIDAMQRAQEGGGDHA